LRMSSVFENMSLGVPSETSLPLLRI